jgi:hypothetical protein
MSDNKTMIFEMKKKGNKLVLKTRLDTIAYQKYISLLKEDTFVSVTFEASHRDNTKAQLAKIHAMIKEIADETGESVLETKKNIKNQCGLTFYKDKVKSYRSFADCSKVELMNVIENIYQLGIFLNINFKENFGNASD